MQSALRAVLITLFSAGVALAATRPSPSELRRLLDEILASGYRLDPPMTVRVRDYLDWLLERLARTLGGWSQGGPLAGLPTWVSWLLFGVCVGLLALLVAHMISGVRAALSEPARRSGSGGGGPRREDPQAVLAAAEAALRGGDYEAAVRLFYRAALLQLDRLGVLNHDPARTNWENLAAVRVADADLRASLTHLTRVVDAAVYGGQPITPAAAERCRESVHTIWRTRTVTP